MDESKVQVGVGHKGAYHDFFVHGNPSIAQAYFTGMKVPANIKIRLLDKDGNIIAQRKNL